MKIIYSNDAEMFIVKQNESNGELFLSVVVGGVGMYEVEKKMTEEMVARFNENPIALLDFVRKIRLAS